MPSSGRCRAAWHEMLPPRPGAQRSSLSGEGGAACARYAMPHLLPMPRLVPRQCVSERQPVLRRAEQSHGASGGGRWCSSGVEKAYMRVQARASETQIHIRKLQLQTSGVRAVRAACEPVGVRAGASTRRPAAAAAAARSRSVSARRRSLPRAFSASPVPAAFSQP